MRLLPIRMHGLYVWMHVESHIQIHPCTSTNSYKHLHMHTHPYTFTTHTYCCIQILLFFYSYLSHKTYYLFVPLYSHVIFKYFIIICNSDIVNRVVNKTWIDVLHHLIHEGILGNYYPNIFCENCFSGSWFWFVV